MHSLGWALVAFSVAGDRAGCLELPPLMALCRTQFSAISRSGFRRSGLMLDCPLAGPSVYLQQTAIPRISEIHPARLRSLATLRLAQVLSMVRARTCESRRSDAIPWLVQVGFWESPFSACVPREASCCWNASGASSSVVERACTRDLLHAAGSTRYFPHHSVLRVQVVAGSCGDWLVSPSRVSPRYGADRLSEDQLQAVIAHELAHIQRLDAFVNVFQVCMETLLFYHPAVWWLNKRIRAEREHCCDDVAVSLCGNAVEYARALTLMEEWRSAPVFAMAANRGPLTDRIMRVLGLKTLGVGMRGIGLPRKPAVPQRGIRRGKRVARIWLILRRRAQIPGCRRSLNPRIRTLPLPGPRLRSRKPPAQKQRQAPARIPRPLQPPVTSMDSRMQVLPT